MELFGWTLERSIDWLIPLLVAVALIWSLCWRLGESPYGRVLKGIREDEAAVLSLGKSVFKSKVLVFGITSAMAGFAGAFLSGFLQLATPGLFGFAISLTIFAMVIVGGMGNLLGSVVGALLLSLLEPVINQLRTGALSGLASDLHLDARRRSSSSSSSTASCWCCSSPSGREVSSRRAPRSSAS